jgi:hypothetical protein
MWSLYDSLSIGEVLILAGPSFHVPTFVFEDEWREDQEECYWLEGHLWDCSIVRLGCRPWVLVWLVLLPRKSDWNFLWKPDWNSLWKPNWNSLWKSDSNSLCKSHWNSLWNSHLIFFSKTHWNSL